MRRMFDLSTYLVLDPGLCAEFGMVETARAGVSGGATVVQLRHKTATTAERVAIGLALKEALQGTGALLVIDDDVAAAKEIGADAIHVGQEDMRPEQVREIVGPEMILGLSLHSLADERSADPSLVDYVGVGPVFDTPTKKDLKTPIGFKGLAEVIAPLSVPAVAIGGLKAHHAPEVRAAGAAGMAVVSAICGHPDPEAAARAVSASWAQSEVTT
ncbi:MAG: thiamine phosphate synthase [Pseudomonadota bacterium]